MTDNLNFGNPHKPENFLQLREAVEGLAEACRIFDTPVTGGNVSLYNESPAGSIDPTPTVGMVGLVEDAAHITTQFFKDEGDAIILIGEPGNELGASHYLLAVHGRKAGAPPKLDYDKELAVQDAVRSLIREGVVRSAHDCAEGGLAVALAESCMSGPEPRGARVMLASSAKRADIALFNESQSRIIISVKSADADDVITQLQKRGVPGTIIGSVVGENSLSIEAVGHTFTWPLATLESTWKESIELLMES